MPDETTTPEAQAQLAELRAKLAQAADENLPGVAVDDDGSSRLLCDPERDIEAFLALPDCTACAGSGKDTSGTEFDLVAVHIAGPVITINGRFVRQLCAWCGYPLAVYDLERVAVPDGQEPGLPVWQERALVRVDGHMAAEVPYVDGTDLPAGCCALPDEPAEEPDRKPSIQRREAKQ